MQVSVEATGTLERKMTVAVPAERVDQEVQKRLQSLSYPLRWLLVNTALKYVRK